MYSVTSSYIIFKRYFLLRIMLAHTEWGEVGALKVKLYCDSYVSQLALNSGPRTARQRYAIEWRIAGGPLVARRCMLALFYHLYETLAEVGPA